jgi:hypothetical protein
MLRVVSAFGGVVVGGVFVNYRGVDSHAYGALLYLDLVRRFGADLVFLDAESVPAGTDFAVALVGRVRSVGVVLAVIGPDWLSSVVERGRAVDDPADWVRRELVEAFRLGVQVIPVLIDDADLPAPGVLPVDIEALGRCQARPLRRREITKDLDLLASDLVALDPDLAAAEHAMTTGVPALQEVLNRVDGDVSGLVVQARTIFGGLHFHLPPPAQATVEGGRGCVRRLPADSNGGAELVPAVNVPAVTRGVWKALAYGGIFIGRTDELARLKETTARSGRAAVHGLGGVGKSTLVARFAELYADRFSPVWWVTADSVQTVDSGLADLAAAVDPGTADLPSDQRVNHALLWLAGHSGWLLVLDNLTTPAHATRLLERVRTGTILITSRQSVGWRGVTTLSLHVMAPGEAGQLLNQVVRADWPAASLIGADELCGELGWLPLAVQQAGAYLAQARIMWGSKSRRRSSACVSVLVDDASEDPGPQEPASLDIVGGPRLHLDVRRSLASGPVRSMPVVVIPILSQNPCRMGLVHDQNMVEDLTADSADHSFAVRIHARSPRRAEQHFHLFSREDSVESAGVFAVAIAQDKPQRLDTAAQPTGEVTGLLGRPLRGGMRRDAGDVELASAMLEECQRVQSPAGDRVHVEEVCGDDPLGLGGEELTPTRAGAARGWVDACRVQDLPDRGGRDPVPKPGKFALDPAVAPPWVLLGQPQCQLGERGRGGWAPGASASSGVVPLPGDHSAVPGQQSPRSDRKDTAPAAARQQRRQCSQPEPVSWLVADRTVELSPQHRVLVPQHEQFGVLGDVPAQQYRRHG